MSKDLPRRALVPRRAREPWYVRAPELAGLALGSAVTGVGVLVWWLVTR